MSIVAFVGDCTTTTVVAVAASWPAGSRPVIVESDPTGGSLAAWLDTPTTPSLSTIVASARTGVHHDGRAAEHAATAGLARSTAETEPVVGGPFGTMIHESSSGIRFIAAPVRAREAHRVIIEAGASAFPAMAADLGTTWLADLGRYSPADRPPRLADLADAVVIVHRQHAASAAAAAVRLERTAEIADRLGVVGAPIVLVVIGPRPFDVDEIDRFVADEGRLEIATRQLDDDPFGAAVVAGRAGVSARRAARMPLLRSARPIARLLTALCEGANPDGWSADVGPRPPQRSGESPSAEEATV